MNEVRELVVIELARFGFYYCPDQPFRLASGESSPEYLDCRAALARPRVLKSVALLFLGALTASVRAVGGLTMGADPIAVAISLTSVSDYWWFSVRKSPKGHGIEMGDSIVGPPLFGGDFVCVVDDVVTTGGSTIQAIRACSARGIRVAQVIALVDRQQGGLAAIQNELDTLAGNTAKASALITLDEVRAAWHVLNPEP